MGLEIIDKSFANIKKITSFVLEMKSFKSAVICTIFFLLHNSVSAQESYQDFFRSTGKINTVLGVVVILFLVLILLLVRVDLKVTKLEKQVKDEK